ncbi:MAG: MBL fold metallo-hydrolase [Bacteroidota bacterium]
MKITFLGTGTSQGVPLIGCDCEVCQSQNPQDNRLRSSVLLESDEIKIVIDAGPDFRQQMLRTGIRHLDAVLITHAHKDHIGGLDDVRAFNYLMKKPVNVYAQSSVLDVIQKDFFYAFDEVKYPGVPDINLHTIDSDKFFVKDLEIIPLEVMHYKMPIFGYRIQNAAYITDANFISDEVIEKIKNIPVLVINALRHRPHISHFSLSETLAVIERIQPKKAFMTHMSHQIGLQTEIEKDLPKNVNFAYDGLTIEI